MPSAARFSSCGMSAGKGGGRWVSRHRSRRTASSENGDADRLVQLIQLELRQGATLTCAMARPIASMVRMASAISQCSAIATAV